MGKLRPRDNTSASPSHARGTLAAELVKHKAVEKAARRIVEAMDAVMRDGHPDHPIRLKAACEARDTVDGKPIERQQVLLKRVTEPTVPEVMALPGTTDALARAMLTASPEARSRARAILDGHAIAEAPKSPQSSDAKDVESP